MLSSTDTRFRDDWDPSLELPTNTVPEYLPPLLSGNEIKPGKKFIYYGLDQEYQSVAVVGIGKETKNFDENERICSKKEAIRVAASAGCKALETIGIKHIDVESFNDAEAAAEGSILSLWKFMEYRKNKNPPPTVALYESGADEDKIDWHDGCVKADGQNFARRLMETPGNLMTPCIFAENIQELFENTNVVVDIHDSDWAKEKKMFSFLSVSQGSVQPPLFLELTYNCGKDNELPYVLVGKGVTFDSGGISLKPSAKMDEMRGDMGGAATVVGALHILSQLKLKKNIKVLIPLVENLPSGSATKPGDVVVAMNGKSICVDNTDAEGRLILADALCYGATFNPKFMVDVATLTGAMVVALGNSACGVFTNCNKLYADLEKAGAYTGDRVWRFPLWQHYTKLVTDYTGYDINNVGKGKGGGSCTAAAFLREFVPEKLNWMHLDIASVMGPGDAASYLSTGMTGRPTRTIAEFIASQ